MLRSGCDRPAPWAGVDPFYTPRSRLGTGGGSGTLTVDLTDDGYLYIHWINVKSDDIEQATKFIAQRFEWFLTKIFE